MDEQYDPQGSYDIFDSQGHRMGEVVKGTVFDGAPNFRHEAGLIVETDILSTDGLTFTHNGARFRLVLKKG